MSVTPKFFQHNGLRYDLDPFDWLEDASLAAVFLRRRAVASHVLHNPPRHSSVEEIGDIQSSGSSIIRTPFSQMRDIGDEVEW